MTKTGIAGRLHHVAALKMKSKLLRVNILMIDEGRKSIGERLFRGVCAHEWPEVKKSFLRSRTKSFFQWLHRGWFRLLEKETWRNGCVGEIFSYSYTPPSPPFIKKCLFLHESRLHLSFLSDSHMTTYLSSFLRPDLPNLVHLFVELLVPERHQLVNH